MLSAPPANLEASLLQRWFPVSPPGSSTVVQPKRFSETDLRGISDVLQRVGRGTWSRIPRIFTVLRLLDRLDEIDLFLAQAISDVYFPFTHQTLPQSLNPSAAHAFLQVQYVVLSSALDLERETGRHRHFSSTNDVPFIKVEELGKGAYGYVDRVISTISYKEYARKLIPRGRTFQRDQKILRDFERELGTLKKLSHHRHIVQLIGSYTDPRFVGILMSPVAECDLKDFLNNCVSDAPRSSKSFIRSFFGCLTAALSYLHDNTIRHKDIKPQNVLVSQHTVFLTDFGISLDWSEIGQSTTTGPTPRTARYCAPEVSDYAPRNSSSDMWSLGCIFLEIWTVLKGETITNLHAFLETNDTKSSCYHLNCEATSHWMKRLALAPNLADNPPQEWIRHLIVPEQRKRWTARQLLSEIETVNMNPEVKFAFSGQCCLDELESAESVISSDESFRDNGVDSAVPHPSLLATHSAHQFAEGEQPEVLSGASDSQHDIALGHADDVSPPPVTLDRQADDVLSREETPSALSEFQRRELSDENNPSVPVNVGESPEKNLNTHTLSKADLGSSGTTSQGLAVDPERSESTYPEVFLPAAQSLSEARSQDTFAERTLQPHGNFKSYPGEETFESAVDAATTTLNAPTEGFNEISILDAAEQAKQTSKLDWSTVKSKTLPLANGSEDSLHPGDIDRDGQMSTTSAYTDGPAQQHIIGAVDAQGFPLLAHSQTSNFSPSSNDRSTHPAEYMTPGPSTDYGITETNKRTMLEDESLKGAEARIIEDDMTEHSNHSKWEGHQPTANPESRTSAPPFPPSSTRSLDSPENGASQPPELSGLTSTDVVPYKPYEAPEKRTESICASCYEPLAGQFVRALSKKFHLECFTCADCNQIVASKFFPAPGKIIGGKFIAIANPPEGHTQEVPLCEYDYFRRLDLLCHSCGEALRGSYVTALEHKYHLEHFVCEEPGCGKSFGASESYFEHEEKVYCRPHYLQQYAELCHGCGTAICEQFVEIYRNGKNQHWHPECYMIHKYWNLQLKNEFAEYFAKHEHPRVNGLEVPQDLVEASMAQSSELTTQLWQVMSKFEESCATSLSDMLQQSTQPSRVKTISISAYFLFKIEGLFLALDEVERLNPLQEQAGTFEITRNWGP
ncbi:hypothetical protein BKA66DRAFT_295311 [Pyrenochaeta sp. MPI-SDFR-AT-0127]|nr:hypothetical protein BKA66DRAFT_295311 [Pyrenochaeta sp. MPI-SDFR-AT-0127]